MKERERKKRDWFPCWDGTRHSVSLWYRVALPRVASKCHAPQSSQLVTSPSCDGSLWFLNLAAEKEVLPISKGQIEDSKVFVEFPVSRNTVGLNVMQIDQRKERNPSAPSFAQNQKKIKEMV